MTYIAAVQMFTPHSPVWVPIDDDEALALRLELLEAQACNKHWTCYRMQWVRSTPTTHPGSEK